MLIPLVPALVRAAHGAWRGARAAHDAQQNASLPPPQEPQSIFHALPPPILVLLALACLLMAACASGMTLGYMSLDTVGLEITARSASPAEAEAAARILPVRANANLLLVTLLLTNTVASELLPLALEALRPGGYFSLVASVVSLIFFGEIIPQALCSRHALEIGARMVLLVKFLRFILFPVAGPIAFMLDVMLGQELGRVYNREELRGLIDVHSRNKYGVLSEDETTILKGTLIFSQETVMDVLTPAEDVYMLDIETRLDRAALLELMRQGHSRVPLYEGSRNNIVCLLLMKQLVLIDPDDAIPIRALINKKKKAHKIRVSPALHCSKDTLLADLLNEFQHGRSHLAIVYDDISKPESERAFLGIVTIEDIIEEILNEEIIDETDVYISNAAKEPVLIRDPNGRLVRSISPSLVSASSKSTGRVTMMYKEIDVERLIKPLARALGGSGKKRGNGKKRRQARKAVEDASMHFEDSPSVSCDFPASTQRWSDPPVWADFGRQDAVSGAAVHGDGSPLESRVALSDSDSLPILRTTSDRPGGSDALETWPAWSATSRHEIGRTSGRRSCMLGDAAESETLLSDEQNLGQRQCYGASSHLSLDMNGRPDSADSE